MIPEQKPVTSTLEFNASEAEVSGFQSRIHWIRDWNQRLSPSNDEIQGLDLTP
jgi:hypothetical protein